MADRVRFEVVPAGVEETPPGVDDAACLEAYGCTETWDLTDPDESYSPFDEGTIEEVVKTSNPDLEPNTELTINVQDPDEKGTDGRIQEVTIECGADISDRFVTFETVLETEENDNHYDYVVKTNYENCNSNDYETLGWIRVRGKDSDTTKDASGCEVRLSSAVHPEREFDPDRVPGNENETYKIGELKHAPYERHVKIPSRFYADRSHVYCTRDEELKRRNGCDEDCTGEHLENPFVGLLQENNWDEVVIEYNDGDGGTDRWLFRVYFRHRDSCPEEIEDAGRDNRTYSGIGLPTSLAVLEGSKIGLSSMDLEVLEDEEAQWQFSRGAYGSAIDRLLRNIETTNNRMIRQERAKGLMVLTEPDHLDMEDSTEAVVGVDATARLLDLIDIFDSPPTRIFLTGTLENILNRDFCSGVPEEHNETLSENFSTEGGPDLMLQLMENSDQPLIRKQAAKALFQARNGKGKPGPPGKALAEINGGNRLLTLYREASDNYLQFLISRIINAYSKNKDCSEMFIESNIHKELLKIAENASAGSSCRSLSIFALRNFPLREPEAMGDIDAPDRLTELRSNSTYEATRENIVGTLACFAGTNEGRELIVDTDAPEEFLQIVVEEEANKKWASKALNNIILSGHYEGVLETEGPGLLVTALEKSEEQEEEVEDEKEVRENLVDALNKLSRDSDPARQAIIEADGLEKLMSMIESAEKNYIKEDSAHILKIILRKSDYGRQKMIRNNGINRLLTAIESQENDSIRQDLTDSLKTLPRGDTCRRIFIDENGVKMILDAIQSSNNPEVRQDLGKILYDHKRNEEWISAVVNSGGSDIVITAFETAVDVNSSTDGEERLNTYRWARLLGEITDTEAGMRATQSADGLRRIKKLSRVLEAQKEQTGDEERTQSALERVQRRLSESQRSIPSKFSGYVFAGAVVHELFTSDSDSTPNKKDTEYSNKVVRGIARVFRTLGRIYGRGLDAIRRLQ